MTNTTYEVQEISRVDRFFLSENVENSYVFNLFLSKFFYLVCYKQLAIKTVVSDLLVIKNICLSYVKRQIPSVYACSSRLRSADLLIQLR